MAGAIRLHLEGMKEDGYEIPAPRTHSAHVDVSLRGTIAARRAYRGPLVSHATLRAETNTELGSSRKRRPVKKKAASRKRAQATTSRRG
jgi:hypothetical protein